MPPVNQKVPVSTDSVDYVRETGRTAAAAAVAEASAVTGSSGTKPEGGFVFDIVTDTIKTFAVYVPATKRILEDAVGLQAYINAYLTYDLARELEDQMLSGSGAGEDFTGILHLQLVGYGRCRVEGARGASSLLATTSAKLVPANQSAPLLPGCRESRRLCAGIPSGPSQSGFFLFGSLPLRTP